MIGWHHEFRKPGSPNENPNDCVKCGLPKENSIHTIEKKEVVDGSAHSTS